MLFDEVFAKPVQMLLRETKHYAKVESGAKAQLLTRLAVIDARRLFVPAGYRSMHDYVMGEFDLTPAQTDKRLRAARLGNSYPVLFDMLADGRLSAAGLLALSPHLERGDATGLIEAAAGKTRAQIETLLVEWFPKNETLTLVSEATPGTMDTPEHDSTSPTTDTSIAPGRVNVPFHQEPQQPSASAAPPPATRTRVEPRTIDSVGMQLQVPRWVHEHMREAMDLLGEQMRDRDYVELIGRAFVVYLAHLQQRRYGATRRPRAPRGSRSSDPRRIPAEIKRQVWSRDEGRCTFVGHMGNRCACRRGLEFDHIVPVARGGPATTENLRLRCRVHNQYEAERVFGTEFMRRKREAAVPAR